MKMDGQIRVKTDGRYVRVYNDLKNIVVGDFHELFFVCSCLGYKHKKSKPLGKARDDRFWSNTINPREWACYYAMLLEEHGMDFLRIQDDKAVMARVEEYANAGMEILIEEFLSDYLITGGGELQLDPGASKELPKNFLHFVFEQIENEIDSSSI
jgi:hypothetical protein